MKHFLKTSFALVTLAASFAGPALAGNYAEGDPRPAPFASAMDRAQVASEAQRWAQTAPQGYPEGNPRAAAVVSSNNRAAVVADTLIWMKSGLAAAQNGEAGADTARATYRQAAVEYARLRSGPEFDATVQSIESRRAGKTASR